MTEPLRIWDAKNLQWINEPHVPVARNPNPVAPKTDTPATQIPDDLKTLYGNAQAFRHAFGSGRFVGAGTVEVLIERIANLESTLAAERASRVQADTEQFNAGIEAAANYIERNALSDDEDTKAWGAAFRVDLLVKEDE